LGIRAGELLGLLEGLAAAFRASEVTAELEKLLAEAGRELSTQSIFGSEYWAADGTWIYEVNSEDGEGVVFADVAGAHPLIRKWEDVVENQLKRWEVDRRMFGPAAAREDRAVTPRQAAASSGTEEQTRQPPAALEW